VALAWILTIKTGADVVKSIPDDNLRVFKVFSDHDRARGSFLKQVFEQKTEKNSRLAQVGA
jgi:hypothetical protein